MRYRATLLGIVAAIFFVSCVSQDSAPVHLSMSYQLRCIPVHGCSGYPDEPTHSVSGIDGLEGLTADCEVGAEVDQFSFLASFEGGDVTLEAMESKCTFSVREGNNVYVKKCKIKEGGKANCEGTQLDQSHPCQISIERDGSDVAGTVCCRSFPLEYKQPVEGDRSLVAPNTMNKPAAFEMEHCR